MVNNLEVNIVSGSLDMTKPARIQVSMFNSHCAGKYLFALSNWVKNNGIQTIEFQISDTLQRHNFTWKYGLDPAQSREKSV